MSKILMSTFVLFFSFHAIAFGQIAIPPPGIITTVAGSNGTLPGYSGDGGLAIKAKLSTCAYGACGGIAADRYGNLFISDEGNTAIREIFASTGIITTIAASTVAAGLAVDSNDNLYFTDGYSAVYERNASTGAITKIAGQNQSGPSFIGEGGPAVDAYLNDPQGIALDSSNNIYVADTRNGVIREISATSKDITTVAGINGDNGPCYGSGPCTGDGGPATSAIFYYPTELAIDSANNIYVTDSMNERVRKVTAATGIITTVAGNGSNYTSGNGGPAVEAGISVGSGLAVDLSGNLFIGESGDIRKVTASTGIISQITASGNGNDANTGDGGPASSALVAPTNLAIDKNNNLYLSTTTSIRAIGGP